MKKFYLIVMKWQGLTYFQTGGLSVSEDNNASFGIDIVGRRIYTIQIKN
jgi:oligopeptidase B